MLKVTSEGKMVETTRLQEVSSLRLSSSSVKQTSCLEMNGNTIAGREVELAPPGVQISYFYTHASLQNTFSF